MHLTGSFEVVSVQGMKVVVKDGHCFEYPVDRAEVVTLHGKTLQVPQAPSNDLPTAALAAGVFLLFDPQAQVFYVLNACSHPAHLLLYASRKNQMELLWHGVLQAGGLSPAVSSSQQDLKNLHLRYVQVLPVAPQVPCGFERTARPAWQALANVEALPATPVQWCCLFTESDYRDFLLRESLEEGLPPKPAIPLLAQESPVLRQEVIDLHIDELTDASETLKPHQKLQMQVDAFRKKLDDCRLHRISTLTVIHGVGKGVLKQELLKILADEPGLRYKDAPYHEYGYGALVLTFF